MIHKKVKVKHYSAAKYEASCAYTNGGKFVEQEVEMFFYRNLVHHTFI